MNYTKLSIFVGGFAAGVAAGFWHARKTTPTMYKTVEVPLQITPDPVVVDENQLSLPLTDETQDADQAPTVPTEVVNIFRTTDDVWDEVGELASRIPGQPYVIHVTEFVSNESGLRQETFTWYESDQIMADGHDQPVYDLSQFGQLLWGHGSEDKNIVYIRNENKKCEWEILRHRGSYQEEVLGLYPDEEETELKHSVLRFRDL